MKKRGFTLVEVLAVIVILGFLIVLIVPTVNSLIKDSEDSLESRQISSIIAATKQYVTMNSDLLPDENASVCISLSQLIDAGVIDNEIVINPKTKSEMDGCVLISYNNNYNQYEYSYSDSDISNYHVDVVEFDYTGSEQSYTASRRGFYKLEVWGAQGGSYDSTYIGGYGGYSVGTIQLSRGEQLYINVGGSGSSGLVEKAGGYNGGGISYGGDCNGGTNRYGASGGGATHIAKSSGVLSSFDTNNNGLGDTTEITPILIVAGGGGGSHNMVRAYGSGGSGGGIAGLTSTWTNNGHSYYVQPTGGTQTAGGLKGYSYGQVTRSSASFGKGQDYTSSDGTCDCGSGGGGGFYGGGSGQFAPGGGGSGYIGSLTDASMYCYGCTESNDVSTKTISTTGSSDLKDAVNCSSGFSNDPVSKCAKAGNGFARITYLGK